MNPNIKRLAIMTNPHDMKYGKFEGIIEKGQYGAGKTIIWDDGTYEILTPTVKNNEDLKKHKYFEFKLNGKKLKGIFIMIRTKRGWLLRKKNDNFADSKIDVTKDAPTSVKSGKRVEEVDKSDGYIGTVTKGYGI
jgi:bifunctional non-homologous end joining protein LigD